MMYGGLPVKRGCKVKTLDIVGLTDVDKTGEMFSPDRSSNGLMARRDLGDWPSWYRRGSLIRRIRIRAAGQVLQPVGPKHVLMKVFKLGRPEEGASYTRMVLRSLGGGNEAKSG